MKVRPALVIGVGILGVLVCLSVARIASVRARVPALVPVPANIERRPGNFALKPSTHIVSDAASMATAQYLAEQLRRSTGYPLQLDSQTAPTSSNDNIVLNSRGAETDLGPEGYELSGTATGILIRASGPAGMFYGAESLLQLCPPAVFADHPVSRIAWRIPCVQIWDEPRFAWRGFMLDVSRHFFNTNEIKRVLDLMALHKLNSFHWHLTDDQGWRIEIKKYPRLVQVGAWRRSIGFGLDPKTSTAYGADGRYGGYYSQADVRAIVAYAQARHITIVPEIEMPGHSSAALTAYPEFACPVPDAARGPADVYCAGNDNTFKFLEDVLTEVCELFPGRYIHIGGDEVSKRAWRECPLCQARVASEDLKTVNGLQSYFVRRMGSFLQSKGRSLLGWSEIGQGELQANATVMDWLGGGGEVATRGYAVVRCPNTNCYFDYYQSQDRSSEPPASGACLPLAQVYSFEPVPKTLAPQYQGRILGAQANLWTEYVPSLKEIEYMTFPRLCALAEVAWSPERTHNWSDFRRRLEVQCQRLDQLKVNYRKLPQSE